MLLYPLPLPTVNTSIISQIKSGRHWFSVNIVSAQESSPETEALTFSAFVAHAFHYNHCAKSSIAVAYAWKNLHPPFPKQFIVITLIAGRSIFFHMLILLS